MAKESTWSIFFLEDNENERFLRYMQRLTREIFLCLQHRPLTRCILQYAEETSILVARVARDLQNCLPTDPVLPTRLNDSRAVDFSQLQ